MRGGGGGKNSAAKVSATFTVKERNQGKILNMIEL